MTQVFLSLAILLSLCCAITSGADDLELRVMSFNIRYGSANDGQNHWKNRKEMVCDVLQRHDPDIVGLQEALRFQIDYIRDALPEYEEIGVGRDDGKTKGEYSAILYCKDSMDVNESGTFWFSGTPEIPGSKSWGNQITRICTWGRFTQKESGEQFYLFNTHLDHQSQPSREKSAVLLASRIKNRKYKEPFVVTGDFNADENNPVIMYLKGQITFDDLNGNKTKTPVPMIDTFRVLHPDAADVGTFNSFKGDCSGGKIDYVFVPPGTKVLEAKILYDSVDGRYPSDHFPVMARFCLSLSGKR